MKKKFLIVSFAALLYGQAVGAAGQAAPAQQPRRPSAADTQGARPTPQATPRPVPRPTLDLTDFGIQIAPDARLLLVMAALDAAGWDPTPKGSEPSVFRAQLRRDLSVDPALRERLRAFYERHRLKEPTATAAEQAARYVSLAYTLGPAPGFAAPVRSEDLPAAVLDVLDFSALAREFYRQSGLEARLPEYLNMHRAAGDELRRTSIEMARSALTYLNTRPELSVLEQVQAPSGAGGGKKDDKKDERKVTVMRERERRFVIVPDLLAAPGAVNFRVVGDDYYAVVAPGTDPRSSEVRRAYVQFVIDPLVARFGRDIAARRADIKQLLDKERERGGQPLTPDVFLSVARSLVAAADARMDESARLRALQLETSRKLQAAKDQAARDAILKESKERQAAVQDSATAELAGAFERGAVLAFHFAEQLRDLEGSGFDVATFISPMVADFKVERELRRPSEFAPVVARVREARRLERAARAAAAAEAPADPRRAALFKSLGDVEDLLRLKNYEAAEERLRALQAEYKEEPRVYFGLGQAAMLSAETAFDETLQEQRLSSALQHFRQVVLFASPETDRALLSRTHAASGRILAFLERTADALREFDAAIALGDVPSGAYKEALAEKRKLTGQN